MAIERQKRKPTDWESVEPLFRAGVLSNYQICEQYKKDHQHSQTFKTTITEKAIRNRAKALGWQKNIAEKVREKINEKLVRNNVRNTDQSDEKIIEEAAEAGTKIVLRHQKEINALVSIETSLLEELEDLNKMKGIDGEDKIRLSERTMILKNLTETRAKRIAMERIANNIDATTAKDDIKKIEIELIGKN
jgi:hypothetical protein